MGASLTPSFRPRKRTVAGVEGGSALDRTNRRGISAPDLPASDFVVADGSLLGGEGVSDYEAERRPVILCIVLAVVTLGLYPSIWLVQRRAFVDSLQRKKDLGVALPVLALVTGIIAIVVPFAGKDAQAIQPVFSVLAAISSLMARFRILDTLRTDSARTGRFLEFSSVATFFLGIFYLQYKINQLADQPARVERPRRKKKRKKPIETETAPLDDAQA